MLMQTPISADDVVDTLTRTLPTIAPEAHTREWTRVLLAALAGLGERRGHCINPPQESLQGLTSHDEFLWDLSISTWPRYGGADPPFVYPDYYQGSSAPELVLVAESEWGKRKDAHVSGAAVMEDFAKLLAARCPLKVMIFSYHHATSAARHSSYDHLKMLMTDLINRSHDDATYVLQGVAWDRGDPPWHPPLQYSRRGS
jgi:hypothetical protein